MLDTSRHYSLESLAEVINPVQSATSIWPSPFRVGGAKPGKLDAIAVGPGVDQPYVAWARPTCSRAFSLCDGRYGMSTSSIARLTARAWSSTHCLRRHARCIDVAVTVDHRFEAGRIGFRDVRPIKHILDARFGNYSRLVQFCIVGASGMVIDLSCYALLQFLLQHTWLAQRRSALLGSTWHLAIAAALSIAIALVWNFTLNRRLTFNDSHRGGTAASVLHLCAE